MNPTQVTFEVSGLVFYHPLGSFFRPARRPDLDYPVRKRTQRNHSHRPRAIHLGCRRFLKLIPWAASGLTVIQEQSQGWLTEWVTTFANVTST